MTDAASPTGRDVLPRASDCAGVVLAGGRASRVDGADKAMFLVAGVPLLSTAVQALSRCAEIVVVGSPDGRPVFDGVHWVREDPPFAGPVAALAAAISRIGSSELLVLPADLPGAAEAASLLLAHDLDGDSASDRVDGVVLQDPDGIPQWLTARYRTASLAGAISGSGAVSVRAVVASLRLRLVPAPASATRDVDTWEDLHQAKGTS